MKGSLGLGKILGIPIKLHASWFLVAILLTWSLSGGYFPQAYPGWSTTAYWSIGAITVVFLFVSVLLHELGHSIVALRERVPVKSITLFFFGGIAQIDREPPTAGAEFRIAIAGPVTSLIIAGVFRLLSLTFGEVETLAAAIAYLGRINLILALFNMIPGFPLDGGRVLRATLWALSGSLRTATRWASRLGRGVGYAFIFVGLAQVFFLGSLGSLWTVFIGWFLNNAARASYDQVVLRDALSGVKARNAMAQRCPAVPGDLPLGNLINDYVLEAGYHCFYVEENDRLEGLITLENLRPLGRRDRSALTTRQIMTPINQGFQADPEEDVLSVLEKMDEARVNQVPVTENGRFLGVITRENLLQYLRLRNELAQAPTS